jgi:thiamine biosynthesis protein ThiS
LNIVVNGEERTIQGELSVLGFLQAIQVDPKRVVVELNRAILQRDRLAEVPLRDGDELEIVHFVGGG